MRALQEKKYYQDWWKDLKNTEFHTWLVDKPILLVNLWDKYLSISRFHHAQDVCTYQELTRIEEAGNFTSFIEIYFVKHQRNLNNIVIILEDLRYYIGLGASLYSMA